MKKTALNREKTKFENSKVIFIAPAVVIIWLLIIYAIKGIFPFGDGTIVQYDLQYGVVPASYFHLWDAFHGGNLFYDFTTACGFGRSMLTQLFYPTNIFILLLKREWIYAGVSVLLILKLAVVAFTSSYTFSKIFPKLPSYYTLLISVMYTFCGYDLMYYTNIDWLDTVALYPLIILFALNMFKGKSKLPYFLALAYTLIFNTYMAWFVVISLVVFGGTYVFTVESKENRKRDIYCLGTGTGAALAVSTYSVYIYFGGITSGARFDSGSYYIDGITGNSVSTNGITDIIKTPIQIDINSVLMFLGFACAISFLAILLIRSLKNKSIRKITLFFTITLAFLVMEAVLNSCLLLWHGGSFQYFPYRNGYMVAFFGCLVIGYYLSEFDNTDGLEFKKDLLNFLPFAACFFLAIGILAYADVFYFSLDNYNVLSSTTRMQAGTFIYPYSRFAIILFITYIVLRAIKYKKVRTVITVALILSLTALNSFRLVDTVAPTLKMTFTDEMNTAFTVGDVYKNNKEFERVNNTDTVATMNYGYWSNVPTLSNWTHSLSDARFSALDYLGFSHISTIQYDGGGTQFSKALLRITDSFAKCELDEGLYEKQGKTDGLNFYANKYTLPLGLCFSDGITETKFEDAENIFEYQNDIYEKLTDNTALFNKVTEKAKETYKEKAFAKNEKDENGEMQVIKYYADYCTCNYAIRINGEQAVYMCLTNGEPPIAAIRINGEPLKILGNTSDSNSNSANDEDLPQIYPKGENSNILELGAFENETVELEIVFYSENGNSDNILLYTMDLEKMQELCDSLPENAYTVEGDTVRFSTTAKNDGDIVFVPLGYEDKWNCTVNGEAVKPVCILGDFIGIEVYAGKNDIVLSYSHTQAYILLASIFVGFAIGIALIMLEKKLNNKIPKFVYTVMSVAFTLIYGGAVGILYIIPTGYTAVSKIIELIA